MNCRKPFELYQGEPLAVTIADKLDDGYVADISSYEFEALMRDNMGHIVHSWSSSGQSVRYAQAGEAPKLKGTAIFALSGAETAKLEPRKYTIEIARVFSGARAIKVLESVIVIKSAMIREGV